MIGQYSNPEQKHKQSSYMKGKTQGRNPFTLEIGFPSISKNKNALLDDSSKYII